MEFLPIQTYLVTSLANFQVAKLGLSSPKYLMKNDILPIDLPAVLKCDTDYKRNKVKRYWDEY